MTAPTPEQHKLSCPGGESCHCPANPEVRAAQDALDVALFDCPRCGAAEVDGHAAGYYCPTNGCVPAFAPPAPIVVSPEQAEAVVDATLDLVDEVTRLRAEVATYREKYVTRTAYEAVQAEVARLQAQRLEDAEKVREWCAVKAGTCCYRRILNLDLAAVLGVGRG